ncbi:MAG: hypothetical protein HYZ53_10885 [Planctomycetes bacterium]|nr:hypothetical protein [Planctomycetota bacterium]
MQRRRILVLVGLFLLPALVIEMRLFELQVLEGARFREEAERKVTTIELLPSMRGRILDRNGEILARDRRSFEVDLVPQRLRVASATPASVVADLGLRSERLDAGSELGARPASIARLAQLFRLRRESLEGALA